MDLGLHWAFTELLNEPLGVDPQKCLLINHITIVEVPEEDDTGR
jgi:hypothetical protein